jgi:hypothetical protein
VQATRIRPDTRPTDLRRLAAAGLSALIPGLGQLYNRRRRLATLFVIPSLIILVIGLLVFRTQSPTRLAAWVVAPQVLGTLLAFDLLLMAWRLVAVGQAFLDTRRSGPTGPLAIVGVLLIALFVALPHLVVYRYGTVLGDTFDQIFSGEVLSADHRGVDARPVPRDGQRINVLLIGSDQRGNRKENLTDTMMVASLDPVGHTVSLVKTDRHDAFDAYSLTPWQGTPLVGNEHGH